MKNILVVGDIILDEYIYYKPHKQNPENRNGMVNIVDRHEYKLGGAASVALICNSLGAHASLLGSVGQNTNGEIIKKLLSDNKISSTILHTSKLTTKKTRYINIFTNLFDKDRLDEEDITTEYYWMHHFPDLSDFDIILLQDYGKGLINEDLINYLHSFNIPIIVDPYIYRDWKYYGKVYAIKCNYHEASLVDNSISLSPEILTRFLYDKFNTNIIITTGSNGIFLSTKDKNCHFPTDLIIPKDICGAGDTVLATIGACYINGFTLEKSCIIANKVAKDQIQSIGINPVKNLSFYLTS